MRPSSNRPPASFANLERVTDGNAVVLVDGASSIRVEQLTPTVLLSTIRGQGRHTELLARAMSAEIEAAVARVGALHNFYDGWLQSGHDPAIRQHWQTWAAKHRGAMRSTQMLFRPKNTIATMAVTVANLVLGGSLTIHSSQSAFEAAINAARENRTLRR